MLELCFVPRNADGNEGRIRRAWRPKSGSHLEFTGARGCINATLVLGSSSEPPRYFCSSVMYSLGSSSSLTVVGSHATSGQDQDSPSSKLSVKSSNATLRPSESHRMVYEFREKTYSEKEHGSSVDKKLGSYESQAQGSETSVQLPLRVRLVNRKPPSPSHLPHFKRPLN